MGAFLSCGHSWESLCPVFLMKIMYRRWAVMWQTLTQSHDFETQVMASIGMRVMALRDLVVICPWSSQCQVFVGSHFTLTASFTIFCVPAQPWWIYVSFSSSNICIKTPNCQLLLMSGNIGRSQPILGVASPLRFLSAEKYLWQVSKPNLSHGLLCSLPYHPLGT